MKHETFYKKINKSIQLSKLPKVKRLEKAYFSSVEIVNVNDHFYKLNI